MAGLLILREARLLTSYEVEFRVIMFRPFVGEVISAKLKHQDETGLVLTLGFFDDIIVPAAYMQVPSTYKLDSATGQKLWFWVCEHGEFVIDGFDEIRFQVQSVSYPPLPLEVPENSKPFAPMVITGEEGALSMTTRLKPEKTSKGVPVNYCSEFRSLSTASACEFDGVSREVFNLEVNAKDNGFEPSDTPRTDRSVSKNIELGLSALRGEKGPAYDRIVLNAGLVDHLLGSKGAEDIPTALNRAREAIDSGNALKRLLNYIKASHKV
ncbi:hypothetical protein QQ045_019082 [Rhodiola kirilowii]